MITYQEFKNKWIGKGIDYDGSYGNQCMDVYRMYVKEVLGCPQSPAVQGAKNVWDTYLSQYFDRVANSPTGVPEQGDIIIWGMNPYGHIAICDSATTSTLTCFEQNWTELNGSGVTEIRKHSNYNNVLGWLKFKKQEIGMTDDQKRALTILENFKIAFNHGNLEGAISSAIGAAQEISHKDEQIQTLQEKVLSLDKFVKELEDRIVALESDLQSNLDLVDDWQSKYQTANKQLENKNKEIEDITTEKNQYKNWYETALKKTIDKYSWWELIKLGIKKLFIKK